MKRIIQHPEYLPARYQTDIRRAIKHMNEDTKTIKDIEVLVDTLLHVIEQQAKTIDQLIKLKSI